MKKSILFGLMLSLVLSLVPFKSVSAAEIGDYVTIEGVRYEVPAGIKELIDSGYEYIVKCEFSGDVKTNLDSFYISEVWFGAYPPDCNLAFGLSTYEDFIHGVLFDGLVTPSGSARYPVSQYYRVSSNGSVSLNNETPTNYTFTCTDLVKSSQGVYCYDKMIYSSRDLYCYDGHGNQSPDITIDLDSIFFQQTLVPMTELPKIVEKAGLAGIMDQVVRILPITIPIAVSYLGLRKGLNLLGNLFYKA